MADLTELTLALLPDYSTARSADDDEEPAPTGLMPAEVAFLEAVTFADADDIIRALRTALSQDWIGLPVWARHLAFRLAILQRPDDARLHQEAAADLHSFGPDWDDIAAKLAARAELLEGSG
jgi:hypothetical protein